MHDKSGLSVVVSDRAEAAVGCRSASFPAFGPGLFDPVTAGVGLVLNVSGRCAVDRHVAFGILPAVADPGRAELFVAVVDEAVHLDDIALTVENHHHCRLLLTDDLLHYAVGKIADRISEHAVGFTGAYHGSVLAEAGDTSAIFRENVGGDNIHIIGTRVLSRHHRRQLKRVRQRLTTTIEHLEATAAGCVAEILAESCQAPVAIEFIGFLGTRATFEVAVEDGSRYLNL